MQLSSTAANATCQVGDSCWFIDSPNGGPEINDSEPEWLTADTWPGVHMKVYGT